VYSTRITPVPGAPGQRDRHRTEHKSQKKDQANEHYGLDQISHGNLSQLAGLLSPADAIRR
jgi:hypothetical protein